MTKKPKMTTNTLNNAKPKTLAHQCEPKPLVDSYLLLHVCKSGQLINVGEHKLACKLFVCDHSRKKLEKGVYKKRNFK